MSYKPEVTHCPYCQAVRSRTDWCIHFLCGTEMIEDGRTNESKQCLRNQIAMAKQSAMVDTLDLRRVKRHIDLMGSLFYQWQTWNRADGVKRILELNHEQTTCRTVNCDCCHPAVVRRDDPKDNYRKDPGMYNG